MLFTTARKAMVKSYTFSVNIFGEFKSELQRVLHHIDFKPVLALAFVSSDFPLPELMNTFRKEHIRLLGTTTAGEMMFSPEKDIVLEKGAVFVLTNIPASVFHLEGKEQLKASALQLGNYVGNTAKKTFKKPGVLFVASGLQMDGHNLTRGILQKGGSTLPLFGGLAGDDLKFEKTIVFTEKQVLENGVVFLVFDTDLIEMQGMMTSGWIGLGSEFQITKAKGNIIYEINDQPALDLYTSYLSISEDDLPTIGIEYPLMVKFSDNSVSTRIITGIESKKRSIILSGSIPENSQISFSASPGFELLEHTREKIIAFHNKHRQADLILLFSAVARNIAMGPLISTEIKLAPIKWQAPLAGFFGYGETGKNGNENSTFCNQSFTLVLLKEKSAR